MKELLQRLAEEDAFHECIRGSLGVVLHTHNVTRERVNEHTFYLDFPLVQTEYRNRLPKHVWTGFNKCCYPFQTNRNRKVNREFTAVGRVNAAKFPSLAIRLSDENRINKWLVLPNYYSATHKFGKQRKNSLHPAEHYTLEFTSKKFKK